MTLLGLNIGLLAVPKGLVFTVPANYFHFSNATISNPSGTTYESGLTMRVSNINFGTRHPDAMPYGGKVVMLKVFRRLNGATVRFSVAKNDVETTMTTGNITNSDLNNFVTAPEGVEIEFNAGDRIGFREINVSGTPVGQSHQALLALAFNIGSDTP